MKTHILIKAMLISLLISVVIFTQTIPQTINYQGLIKDAAGVVVPNGDYSLTFKLYDLPSGGSALWNETKTINVVDGIINTQLGSVTPIPSSTFAATSWLGITVGVGSELSPRIRLTSVPYSFMSMNVPNGSITATKIADAQVVKSLNGLKDNVNLVAGSNVTITPSGNNLTISSAGGGGGTIGGSGTTNYLPLFTNSTTLGNSSIYQNSSDDIGIGLNNPSGRLEISCNSVDTYPHILLSETDGFARVSFRTMTAPFKHWVLAGHTNADDNSSQWHLNYFNGSVGKNIFSVFGNSNILFNGNVGIGTNSPSYPLHVESHQLYGGYFTSDSLSVNAHTVHSEFLGTGYIDAVGVYGKSVPADYYGYGGYFHGGFVGVRGEVTPTGSISYSGVQGIINGGGPGNNHGVYGAVWGGSGINYGIYGEASGGTTNWAGYFLGNVSVTGTLSKGGGSFKIDHPLDPANKYLYHSFVESPDMMNIYNGNVVTDGSGYATVTLPDWFEALNKEFRYQLTVIGDFAQAIISQKIQNNQFIIRTDKPGIEVSWQVTGIRHDKFAEKYRIPVEENKTGEDVGKYLHPDAFGIPESMGIDYETHKKALDKK